MHRALLEELNSSNFSFGLLLLFLKLCSNWAFWLDIELDFDYFLWKFASKTCSALFLLFEFCFLIIISESYSVGILLPDFCLDKVEYSVFNLKVLESKYSVSKRLIFEDWKWTELYLLFMEFERLWFFFLTDLLFFLFYFITLSPYSSNYWPWIFCSF